MIEIRDTKPHSETTAGTAECGTHQEGQRERRHDGGEYRSAIAQPLAKVLETNDESMPHMRSVAQRAACHPQKNIFQVRFDHPNTLRDHPGAEQRGYQSG